METKLYFGPSKLQLVHPCGIRPDRFNRLVADGEMLPKVSVWAVLNQMTGHLRVSFEVASYQPLHVNESLSRGASQDGLWNWDVVEIFLQPNVSSPTYYEFVMSPLGQHFELEIFEPRVRTNPKFRSSARFHGFEVRNQGDQFFWNANMEIDLKTLGWKPETGRLKWNCFAILGNPSVSPGRSYWGLNLPEQAQPDFHLPKHFTALD